MKHTIASRVPATRSALLGMALAPAFAFPATAGASEINVGVPELKVRFDNTVRYGIGIRAKDCDPNICGNGAGAGDITAHQSDSKFAKAGDVTTSRFDLLSEFDVAYKSRYGLRVSATAWYDTAYSNRIKGDPALSLAPGGAGQGAGRTGEAYTSYTKRWNIGPSGEFLDAFVFGKFDIGDVSLNVRLGQHNIYWGESVFSFVGGVAYAQGPVDIRKAVASPGAEAKELFKPLNQLSFSADLSDRVTLAGQYFLDWKPSPLPDGGTYFGAADGLSLGGGGSIFGVPFGGVTGMPARKRGDWGLALKLRPQWLDGTVGIYLREYTDKLPQLVMSGSTLSGASVVPTQFGLDYSTPRQKMLGFSLSKQVGDVSVGSDLTYRKDAQLAARPFATPAGNADLGAGPVGSSLLPTGDVFAGVVNAISYFGRSPMFDSATLTTELNFAHLIRVGRNPQFFSGEGFNCPSAASGGFPYGCATRNSVGLAVLFEPKWFQARNGVDLSLPMFVSAGLKGNSPVPFGDRKGQGTYSVGLSADVKNQYAVTLKYIGYLAKHTDDAAGFQSKSNSPLGKYWDRNWVSLTLKTTF